MPTNPVANPLNRLTPPPAAQGQRKEDGPTFGQLLLREVADRKETEPAQSPRLAQADKPAPDKQEQMPATPSSEKTENGAEKADRAEAGVKKKLNEEARGGEDAVSSVSVEMLALVNSLNITATCPEKAAANGSADLLAPRGKRGEALLGATGKLTDTLTDTARTSTQAALADIQGTASEATHKAEPAMALTAGDVQSAGASEKRETVFTVELQSALETAPGSLQPLQQTVNVVAQVATAQVTEHIAPRVGSPAWEQAIGQSVVWMINGDQQTAELTLNPPDLGPLKVVLNVSNAQADATFSAPQPEVRQALEAAMPKLRDMLSEAGIQLSQASVNSGAANQSGDADKQARQSSNGQGGGGNGSDGRNENASVARVQPTSVRRGLVDTFA